MRTLVALALVLGVSCRSGPMVAGSADQAAEIIGLALDFPEPGQGELRFSARLPAAPTAVTHVSWELWLKGRPFASGLGQLAPSTGEPRLLTFTQGLRYGALGYDPRPRRLDARLKGSLTTSFGRGEVTLDFDVTRKLEVRASPMLESPEG